MSRNGWIGVDLDGTLAYHDEWKGALHIGEPIPLMVARVKQWLADGITVKIFTARAHPSSLAQTQPGVLPWMALKAISDWCVQHLGQPLEITCTKDMNMLALWDDRAVRVEPNTGEIC